MKVITKLETGSQWKEVDGVVYILPFGAGPWRPSPVFRTLKEVEENLIDARLPYKVEEMEE